MEGYPMITRRDNKYNFINEDGTLVSDRWFDEVYSYTDGFALVKDDSLYNFIDAKGQFISNCWFEEAWSFNDGYAIVKFNGKLVKLGIIGNMIECN